MWLDGADSSGHAGVVSLDFPLGACSNVWMKLMAFLVVSDRN